MNQRDAVADLAVCNAAEKLADSPEVRLEAWQRKKPGRFVYISLRTSIAFITIGDPKLPNGPLFCWSFPFGKGSEVSFAVGTEDKPGTLAEMADAILRQWEQLYGDD